MCSAHLIIYLAAHYQMMYWACGKIRRLYGGPTLQQSRITWGWFWIENLKDTITIQTKPNAWKEKIIVGRDAAGMPTNPRREHTTWWKQSDISILHCKQGDGNVVPLLGMKNTSTISYVFSSVIIHEWQSIMRCEPFIVKIAIAWSLEGRRKWIRGVWTLIENVETMGTKQRKNEPM